MPSVPGSTSALIEPSTQGTHSLDRWTRELLDGQSEPVVEHLHQLGAKDIAEATVERLVQSSIPDKSMGSKLERPDSESSLSLICKIVFTSDSQTSNAESSDIFIWPCYIVSPWS